jgi:DNA-binding transcriptional regulator YhcF (GntR family)
MNSYILSRQWFDFAFENASKVKPIHGSLYFWIIELANRLGWPAEFGNPASQCMAACGIASYNTYKKAFDELTDFGFINVKRKSINQYSSCVIALSIIDKAQYKALDKALAEHNTKHLQSTVQSTDSINKPLTLNIETTTSNPSGSAEPKQEHPFLCLFNEVTGRQFKVLSNKADRQYKALKKSGFTYEQFRSAVLNGFESAAAWDKPSLFTPEYITREDKFLQFLYWKQAGLSLTLAQPQKKMVY